MHYHIRPSRYQTVGRTITLGMEISEMSYSNRVAISVCGLSKSYIIGHNNENHTTVVEALLHRLKNPFQRTEKETFWALKDLSFDIQQGDVVGVIGRNGAGKSTLLKIMSGITEPTEGDIRLYG